MNPSHPTQNPPDNATNNPPDDATRDQRPQTEPPRLENRESPLASEPFASEPLRGEIFDVSLAEGASNSTETPQRGAALWFVAGIALLFFTYNFGAMMGARSKVPAPIGPFTAKNSAGPPIEIHIVGAVKRPGVYSLPNGARLQDAIKTAGGALPGADLDALNLADWAADGSKIEVPTRQKAAKASAPLATPTPVVIIKEVLVTPPQNTPADEIEASKPAKIATTKAKTDDGMPHAATQSGGKSSNVALDFLKKHPVDLNRASETQLEILPGVGPKMAQRIIAYRLENKGFKSIDDLDNVKGIGDKRMATLRLLVKIK